MAEIKASDYPAVVTGYFDDRPDPDGLYSVSFSGSPYLVARVVMALVQKAFADPKVERQIRRPMADFVFGRIPSVDCLDAEELHLEEARDRDMERSHAAASVLADDGGDR